MKRYRRLKPMRRFSRKRRKAMKARIQFLRRKLSAIFAHHGTMRFSEDFANPYMPTIVRSGVLFDKTFSWFNNTTIHSSVYVPDENVENLPPLFSDPKLQSEYDAISNNDNKV